jgi:hypothetical protein
LADEQVTDVRMHDQLPIGVDVKRLARFGLTELGRDVHLAHVVHEPGCHGLRDQVGIAAACRHQGTCQRHGLDRMRKRLRPGTLTCGQQQLHDGMQTDGRGPALQGHSLGAQQGGERPVFFQQVLNGRAQGVCRDAIFGDQAGFERLAQGAIHQLLLQLARDGLVTCPELDAPDVEDVAGGDDRLGLAGFQDGGQGVRIGGLELFVRRGLTHDRLLSSVWASSQLTPFSARSTRARLRVSCDSLR